MVDFRTIGTSTPRVEGVEKATGRAMYAADRALPGTIWGRVLHSARPHARIVRIDATEARRLPGVHAVITGADIAAANLYGRAIKDMPVLAVDRVRYVGERIAAVAAEDEETAQRAVDLIEVEYEDLPAVFEPAEALADGAPLIHPDYGSYPGMNASGAASNAYRTTTQDRGDLDAGFAEADVVVEHTYTTQRQHQAYLEPHTSLVSIEDGRVNVWTNSKVPYGIRDVLAFTTGVPAQDIVVHHVYIGGDFGGKGTPLNLPICYYLAQASGRPVRMVADYVQEFMAGEPRHATVIRLRTGVKRDGTLVAHHVQFYVNCGAYAAYKPAGVIGGANHAAGPYRIPNTRVEAFQVYTNTVPGGHMRTPGGPQTVFALESHIDQVAREVGMDPLAFRRQNLATAGEENAAGERFEQVRAIETLDAAAEAARYDAPRPANVGRGMAVGDHAAGGGQGSATVTLSPDGGIVLGTPIFDQGTGTYTTLLQVVAEELAVPVERIQLDAWDTGVVPNDSGIGGSRGTRVASAVGHEVAQDARRALVRLAAEVAGRAEEEFAFEEDGMVRHRDGAVPPQSWSDLLASSGRTLIAHGEANLEGRAEATGFAAQIAEVEVDPETGAVRVLNFTSAHDVGRILNPVGHQGQINGGIVQGLGFALMEELRVEDGRVTTLSFGDYKIPSIADIPPLQTVLVESDDGVGPYQVKGIGENSNTPVAAAIANAVADAVGVRIRDLPVTSEKVYAALKQRDGR
ncbi:MAG: xanthine dehydrogenase family protein molybdopterin-binding subunit [Dehalococcoidia bacterium]